MKLYSLLDTIDRFFDAITSAWVNHQQRLNEAGYAAALIFLAFYILDERVGGQGLVRQPLNIPYYTCAALFIGAGILQFAGVCMPVIHSYLKNRGYTNRWLSNSWFSERVWRIVANIVATMLWGMFATLISGVTLAGWGFFILFAYFQTGAAIRLGATVNNARSSTDKLADNSTAGDNSSPTSHRYNYLADIPQQTIGAFAIRPPAIRRKQDATQ